MAVRVLPETFDYVSFDAAYTARIAEHVAAMLGMDDLEVLIEINESSPLTRIDIDVDPGTVTIRPHSGALEDTRRPTTQSELATTITVTRGLLKARDRLRGGFQNAPTDGKLTLAQVAAWDTYIMGRISRMDIKISTQAWLYNFRNRHGFCDAADRIFEKIWSADNLDWSMLDSLSQQAMSAGAGSAS